MFCKGDIVVAVNRSVTGNRVLKKGDTGIVLRDQENHHAWVCVCWDLPEAMPEYFHNCDGLCEDGYGWFTIESEIALVESSVCEEITIGNDELMEVLL